MQERKCLNCGGFGYIAKNCRVKEKKKIATPQSSNKFKVLISKVMNIGEASEGKVRKDKKIVLREERSKEGRRRESKEKKKKSVEVRKTEEETLREMTMKIGLERINTQEEIRVEMLLNSEVTGLVMSFEYARKKRFKLKNIEKPIYRSIGREWR